MYWKHTPLIFTVGMLELEVESLPEAAAEQSHARLRWAKLPSDCDCYVHEVFTQTAFVTSRYTKPHIYILFWNLHLQRPPVVKYLLLPHEIF